VVYMKKKKKCNNCGEAYKYRNGLIVHKKSGKCPRAPSAEVEPCFESTEDRAQHCSKKRLTLIRTGLFKFTLKV
jgi:hypothetical protein